MACVEYIAPMNVDSEMEEGEIVDDLSDISSEEEFLLRQRLEVLENYNNVLERKKRKRSTVEPGTLCAFDNILGNKHKKEDALSYDLSEISATELEDYCSPYKTIKVQRYQKTHYKPKRKKEDPNIAFIKSKEHRKKSTRTKKRLGSRVTSKSSDESEDEYRNRRKRLADAVVVNKSTNDKSSLSERLQKMLCGVNPEPIKLLVNNHKTDKHIVSTETKNPPNSSPISHVFCNNNFDIEPQDAEQFITETAQVIDICSDEHTTPLVTVNSVDIVDLVIEKNKQTNETDIPKILGRDDTGKTSDKDSDDDLELLRQHALKTKVVKNNNAQADSSIPSENKTVSEDEDSDTTELRLICLKSALLKKAIEMKRKQKLQKKLSQSSNIQDDSLDQIILGDKVNSDNNTDIESVDMDIGSDGDEKMKDMDGDSAKNANNAQNSKEKDIPVLMISKEDELEEDEDLLRAKLLTSLSKNLPHLVSPNVIKSIDTKKEKQQTVPKQPQPAAPTVVPEEKRFIINVESDSEGEHEATKNLTKMHMKLSEQKDFQLKLDMFLKSTRMEVEKTTLPDVVQQPVAPKKNEKYVVKAVKNLPKSEQIEYKNLVKRMAELEKIKQARQSVMAISNKIPAPGKDTLKPRNITIETSNLPTVEELEEKIKHSRKHIAEESVKMLKLKEEGTKLSQRFKIAATELRNVKTAIALNRKQQRSVQNYLTQIRLHHQKLLKSSLTCTHSKPAISHFNHVNPRLQKENNPKEHTNSMTNKEIPKDNPKKITIKETPKQNLKSPVSLHEMSERVYNIVASQKESHIENYKNPAMLKAVKIGIVNDLMTENSEVTVPPRLSVEIDIAKNKKVVTTSTPNKENSTEESIEIKNEENVIEMRSSSHPVVEKGGGSNDLEVQGAKRRNSGDYESPLDAFGDTTWGGDPNAILCPFQVCGDCKDADCKYLHTNSPSK